MEKSKISTGRKRKLIVSYKFVLEDKHKEHPTGVSETVPDESYSIRQLLEKFTREQLREKIDVSPGRDDYDAPDLEKLKNEDLVDRQEYAQSLKTDQKQLEAKLKEENNARDLERKKQLDKQAKLEKLLEEKDQGNDQGKGKSGGKNEA